MPANRKNQPKKSAAEAKKPAARKPAPAKKAPPQKPSVPARGTAKREAADAGEEE